jgi:hypothetical protein
MEGEGAREERQGAGDGGVRERSAGDGERWRIQYVKTIQKEWGEFGHFTGVHLEEKTLSELSDFIPLVGDKLTLLSSKFLVEPNPVAAVEHDAIIAAIMSMTCVSLQVGVVSSKSLTDFNRVAFGHHAGILGMRLRFTMRLRMRWVMVGPHNSLAA